MGEIHADQADDNSFQSGSAGHVDASYAFRKWYEQNKERISKLTRVSEANSGVFRALEEAYLAGMTYERIAQRSARVSGYGSNAVPDAMTGRAGAALSAAGLGYHGSTNVNSTP